MSTLHNADNCVFCKIISREIPSDIVAETDDVIVINDRAPKAPVHQLIIPKKHIADLKSLENTDAMMIGKIVLMAKELAAKLSGSGSFRLVVNNGADAGQSVFHLHFHFLSGKQMLDL